MNSRLCSVVPLTSIVPVVLPIPPRLPDMQRRSVQFFSERIKLDGDLYLPEDLTPGEKYPAVSSTLTRNPRRSTGSQRSQKR